MSAPTHLHLYQCSFCRNTATTAVKRTADSRLKCSACFRWMAYLWSSPITTDAQRAIAAQGVVYGAYEPERQPYTKRACDVCHVHVERESMVMVPCVGKFCSEDCAQVGVLRHQQVMERVEKLYQERPELRPVKETA